MKRLKVDFYKQDAVTLAQQLGKMLVRGLMMVLLVDTKLRQPNLFSEDKACHASKVQHARRMMFHSGGKLYIYLIYGIYWL